MHSVHPVPTRYLSLLTAIWTPTYPTVLPLIWTSVLFFPSPLYFFFLSFSFQSLDGEEHARHSLEVPAFYFWFPFQRVACHIKRGNNKISSNNEKQLVSLLSSFPFLPVTNSSIQHSTARAGNNITTNKKRLKYNRFSFSFFQNLSSIVSNHGLIRITSSPDFSYHWQLFF